MDNRDYTLDVAGERDRSATYRSTVTLMRPNVYIVKIPYAVLMNVQTVEATGGGGGANTVMFDHPRIRRRYLPPGAGIPRASYISQPCEK